MTLQDTMEKILALQGMDEFKEFCEKLLRTAENMKSSNIRRIALPNLIFAADPGCGVTLHIRLLVDLLKELKLLQFMGEEEYFEWMISDEKEGLDRLIMRMRRAAGFYGKFCGVVGLNVSMLIKDQDDVPPMDKLMEFVESRQGQVLFIFIIPLQKTESIQSQLQGRFASFTPVELIHMPFPVDEAQYYITDELFGRGFIVTNGAQQALKRAVKSLSQSPSFEGYQTLRNLTDEIIWHKLSQPLFTDEQITARDVQFIIGEHGFITALNAHGVRHARRRVGFGEGDKEA